MVFNVGQFDYSFTTYQDAHRVRLVDGLEYLIETNIARVSPVNNLKTLTTVLTKLCVLFLETHIFKYCTSLSSEII